MLVILEPKTLPKAIPALPLAEAIILTISSGVEVPKATIVSPITILEMPYFFAIEEEPSTKMSAPFINKTKPKTNNTTSNAIKFYYSPLLKN